MAFEIGFSGRKIPWRDVAAFTFRSLITFGTYPAFWVAQQAPRLNREATIRRGAWLADPASNPSPWPWIKTAWLAWVCTAFMVEGIAILAAAMMATLSTGSISHQFQMTGHIPTTAKVTLLVAIGLMTIPQGYLLTELAILLGRTLYPERLFGHIRRRYEESLERQQARFKNRKSFFRTKSKEQE